MNRFHFGFSLCLLALLVLAGCKSQGPSTGNMSGKDEVLLSFPTSSTKVYRSEFEYIYQKNNGGWDSVKTHTSDQINEYLDLYINFKRKVMEAEELGLGDTPEFTGEFEGYRKQLAQPYLVEKKVQEDLVREAYDRSRYVVSASHLLIQAGPDSEPADTLKAYQRCLALRDSIVNGGKSFEEIAERHSQDPSAKSNQGYLGYFSVFDMVYPFESAAFNQKAGEVSMPVRTGFGYHLVLVKDRIESPGKQTSAHIIIRVGPQYTAKTEQEAKDKINEIHQKLKDGADFEEMAATYSDDPTTAKQGGSLGNGRLIPEMENMKRKLNTGEFSAPFSTNFGWHILKVTEVEPLKSFDDSRSELKARISRDARSYLSREVLIKRVKRENGYQLNMDNMTQFLATVQDADKYNKGFWVPVDSVLGDIPKLELYSIGSGDDKQIGTIQDYIDYYLKNRKGWDGVSKEKATEKNLEKFEEEAVLKFEESQLPKKYPEYRELLKEYRDGILLFTLTEDKVWRKAVVDTTGLQQYYEDHKSDFSASERVVVTEFISESRNTVDEVKRLLAKKYSVEAVDSILNEKNSLNVRRRRQTYEKGKSAEEAELFGKQDGYVSGILSYGNAYRVMVVQETLPAGIKSFEDSKSEAITAYQNYLEKTWLEELEKKYPVVIHDKVLEKLFK